MKICRHSSRQSEGLCLEDITPNQETSARLYNLAPEMLSMLRKVVDPDDFISNKEIKALLNRIDGKE